MISRAIQRQSGRRFIRRPIYSEISSLRVNMLRDVAAIRGAAKTVTAGQQMTLSRPKERVRERALVIERFERRERSRPQMRVFEFAVMATLYAKERCNGNIDVAYQELIKALDKGG